MASTATWVLQQDSDRLRDHTAVAAVEAMAEEQSGDARIRGRGRAEKSMLHLVLRNAWR